MEGLVPVLLLSGLALRAFLAARSDERPVTLKPVEYPLCPHCANAHIVRVAGSDKLVIFCDRNSARERIKEEVVECSSFRPRESAPEAGHVHVCGFACSGCARD